MVVWVIIVSSLGLFLCRLTEWPLPSMQAPVVPGDTFSRTTGRVARSVEEVARVKHVTAPDGRGAPLR
jgi:hypothetical protein